MNDWEISLKWYPHFDAPIERKKAEKLVADAEAVAKNTFYPFMLYNETWQPYRSKTAVKPPRKNRPIRYASRRDSYIFSYYRHKLSTMYEKTLVECGIDDVAIAYRKLRTSDGSGKSNIEFAKDAFDGVRRIGNCAAVALDISSFFEHLDHGKLRLQICRVLRVSSLPADYEAIFRAVTSYAVVDRDQVYRRLGYLEDKLVDGKMRASYTKPFLEMPKKLCSNQDFNTKICGRGRKFKSLVTTNRKPWGIPQGSPISDLLANLYLIDFDIVLKEYCSSRGGFYLRYSDDILIVIPGSDPEAIAAIEFARAEIQAHGSKLEIKDRKTAALVFTSVDSGRQSFRHITGQMGKTGLEYLGFRYDGKSIHIRNSTLSSLYRKISAGVKAECFGMIARYPGKDFDFIFQKFDFSLFFQRYGRVRGFGPNSDVEDWTFWTYAQRARNAFGNDAPHISRQLRNYRVVVRRRVRRDLAAFLSRAT